MPTETPTRTQAERADQTRTRILDAATREFAAYGLAGARTDRIADEAGVNKALLYYYYRGKEALYTAALEATADRMATTTMRVLSLDCSPGERVLRSTLNHFDRIYSVPVFQNLMQQEMIRLRKADAHAQSPLVDRLFRPLGEKMHAIIAEGIASGELIEVESTQVLYATMGPNVFYFLSAPMMRLVSERDPFEPAALEQRRRFAIEFLGQSIFIDRAYGAKVAERVLASTPMPQTVQYGMAGAGLLETRPGTNSKVRHK
jgi:TetR/AcrR family transcriptional regulator